jgi:hypothetical protein
VAIADHNTYSSRGRNDADCKLMVRGSCSREEQQSDSREKQDDHANPDHVYDDEVHFI